MNLRNTIVASVVAVAILASTALGGVAQNTATSSVSIGAGAFTTSLAASNFANLPYSLLDQTARGGSVILTVNDQTGDAGGWQVRVTVTNFIGVDRPTQFIPSGNLTITAAAMSIAVDGSQPVTESEMPFASVTAVDGTAGYFVWTANAGYGQGGYRLNLTADLLIPGRTSAQTYTSTGTISVVTGP
jgi:hypothetical protein